MVRMEMLVADRRAPGGCGDHLLPAEVLDDSLGWDVSTWGKALPTWRCLTALRPGSTALEIGAGGDNAGLSLWLAALGYRVTCTGLDEPTDRMRAIHRHHGVAEQITYAAQDVLTMPHQERFDLVVFKSVLGRVGAAGRFDLQQEAVRRMHRALKPGGELWFAENAIATRPHQWARQRFGAGRWGWRYLVQDELPALLSPFTRAQWTSFGMLGALGRSERQRRLLARLDTALVERVVPTSWHYVVAGVAFK